MDLVPSIRGREVTTCRMDLYTSNTQGEREGTKDITVVLK